MRGDAVRSAKYWTRLKQQLIEPMGHDLSIRRELRAVASGSGTIVVGPWLSEVGYEALYWVPFVRWFAHQYRIDPQRLVVVSRGGAGGWYADVAHKSVELLDLFDPDDFARRNARSDRYLAIRSSWRPPRSTRRSFVASRLYTVCGRERCCIRR